MSDIFDEVAQDLRAERARRVFARYGSIFGGIAVLALLAVGGHQAWRGWEARQAAASASRYLAATAAAPDAAFASFQAVAADAPAGYATLARLRAAGAALEQGDGPAAIAIWNTLASDKQAEPLYRELATVLWALAALGTEPPLVIEQRLAPIAEGPWRASVAEARALAARAAGDAARAEGLLAGLVADPSTPAGVRIRAERLRAVEGG